jgi:hypothetical protein
MTKTFKPIMVDSKTKDRIEAISKISSVKQSKVISELMEGLIHVYANFEKASFIMDFSPVSNEVTIKVYGTKRKGALTFGTCPSEQELQNNINKEIRKL